MKNIATLFIVLLLAFTSAKADDDASVRDLIARYDTAYLAGDTATLETLMASDYQVITYGRLNDRATAFADFADPKRSKPTAMSSTVDRVVVDGNLAFATGTIRGTEDKKSFEELFTLVLKRAEGGWQAVAEHISPVEKAPKK